MRASGRLDVNNIIFYEAFSKTPSCHDIEMVEPDSKSMAKR